MWGTPKHGLHKLNERLRAHDVASKWRPLRADSSGELLAVKNDVHRRGRRALLARTALPHALGVVAEEVTAHAQERALNVLARGPRRVPYRGLGARRGGAIWRGSRARSARVHGKDRRDPLAQARGDLLGQRAARAQGRRDADAPSGYVHKNDLWAPRG